MIRIKKGKIYQFLLAISIVVGSVIGTGIFFKNQSIISWSQGNAVLTLLTWIIASLIAICTAASYVEMAKTVPNSNTGVGQFATTLIGKKIGIHTKINWGCFYYVFFTVIVTAYASDYLVQMITRNSNPNTILILITTVVILVVFLLTNVLLPKIAELLQINMTLIKIIPLILGALGGIVTIFILSDTNWWTNGNVDNLIPDQKDDTSGYNQVALIFLLVPAALYSYDSFLGVTNITEDITNKKIINSALITGMIFISIIYILITVAILNTGTLNVQDALIKMIGGDPKNLTITYLTIKIVIESFIFISALGVVNGVTLVMLKGVSSVIDRPTSGRLILFVLGLFLLITGPIFIVTLIYHLTGWNTNIGISVFDAMANVMIILSFSMYALIMFCGLIKYFLKRKMAIGYKKWFPYVTIFAVTTILIVVLYQFFYIFIYRSIANPNVFLGGIPNWLYMVLGLFYIGSYIVFPLIVQKKFKKQLNSHIFT